MTEVTSHQAISRAARRALNPSKVGVSLGWFDRAFGKYYIAGHFPVEQEVIDCEAFAPSTCSNKIGSGKTVEQAIQSLQTQFFGGL